MITQINNLIYLTFKTKASQSISGQLDYLLPELKKFNLPIPPKNMPLTPTYIRTKDFLG